MRAGWFGLAALLTHACALSERTAGPPELLDGLAACLSWFGERGAEAAAQPGEFRQMADGTACFDGTVTGDDEGSVGTDTLDGWAVGPSAANGGLLVVRSHGGDAARTLGIAENLQAARAAVLASEVCASSCANYLYAGLPNRHVTDGTLVIFHGGFSDRSRAELAAELDTLYARYGVLFDDVAADRTHVLGEYDDAQVRQDMLLRQAGASPVIVHGAEAIDLTALPASHCGGDATLRREFFYFGPGHADVLGIAPVTGTPLTEPEAVNAAIAARMDAAERFVACRVPDALGRAS